MRSISAAIKGAKGLYIYIQFCHIKKVVLDSQVASLCRDQQLVEARYAGEFLGSFASHFAN